MSTHQDDRDANYLSLLENSAKCNIFLFKHFFIYKMGKIMMFHKGDMWENAQPHERPLVDRVCVCVWEIISLVNIDPFLAPPQFS